MVSFGHCRNASAGRLLDRHLRIPAVGPSAAGPVLSLVIDLRLLWLLMFVVVIHRFHAESALPGGGEVIAVHLAVRSAARVEPNVSEWRKGRRA